jgi:hypothetical protein
MRLTDVINCIATVTVAIATVVYVCLTYRLLRQMQVQAALATPPALRILPEDRVKGEPGSFTLTMQNVGLSDIDDLQLFYDYLVVLQPPSQPLTITRYGGFVAGPDATLGPLDREHKKEFTLIFKDIYPEMEKAWSSVPTGGSMMLARIRLRYTRRADATTFSRIKIYRIAKGGDFITDYEREEPSAFGLISYGQVKRLLAGTNE